MIILCGIKHCGKSTIGDTLSELLKIPFVDVDTEIENITGKSCRELYLQDGKEAFMKAEAQACENICKNQNLENAIIATGGGICDNELAIKFLTSSDKSKLYYIDVEEDIAFERICHNKEKTGSWPGWISKDIYDDLGKIKEVFHNFYTERTKKYKGLCSRVVPVEKGDSKKAAEYIMEVEKA